MEGDGLPVPTREPITPPLTTGQKAAVLELSKTSVADLTGELAELRERATQDLNEAAVRAIQSAIGQAPKHNAHTVDLFANSRVTGQDHQEQSSLWRITSKTPAKPPLQTSHRVIRITTNAERAPAYDYPSIEVDRLLPAPQTANAYQPHKGDILDERRRQQWRNHIRELQESNIASLEGIPIKKKLRTVIHHERLLQAGLYLEAWLEENSCSAILEALRHADKRQPELPDEIRRLTANLQTAWGTVYREEGGVRNIPLEKLHLDEVVNAIPHAQEDRCSSPEVHDIYSKLTCAICFKHVCEHGYYANDNQRQRFLTHKPPNPTPDPGKAPEPNPWYLRDQKKLRKLGNDYKHQQPSWDHPERPWDNVCDLRGCDHDGPCDNTCPCVIQKLLCEKYCRCTTECCEWKFTGCACHSNARNCWHGQERARKPTQQRECICVQLNRECDPDLCGTCGAREAADPLSTDPAHRCQNISMSSGHYRRLAIGKSRTHGYGLFAAERIPKQASVIEYTGELVSGIEGERRDAELRAPFEGMRAMSYMFTLIGDSNGAEGSVWIDGAKYGNLSRYINSESPNSALINLKPKHVLVNGTMRIVLVAVRNIEPWEELFFNYGSHFFNGQNDEGRKKKRARGRPPKSTSLKTAPTGKAKDHQKETGHNTRTRKAVGAARAGRVSSEEPDSSSNSPEQSPPPRSTNRQQNASRKRSKIEPATSQAKPPWNGTEISDSQGDEENGDDDEEDEPEERQRDESSDEYEEELAESLNHRPQRRRPNLVFRSRSRR